MGNLHEQVPHMFAFAFLTLFPQPFISYFLAYIQTPILPFERILNMMYLSVLLVEFGLGYRAGKNIISIKTARFAVQYREQHMGETGEAGRHAQARSRDDHHSSTKLYSRPGSPDRASSSMPSSSSASSSVSSSAAMMRGSAHARSAMSPSYGMGGAGLPRGAPQPIIPPAGNRGASTSASSAYYRNRANRSHKEGIEMQSLRRKEGRGRGRSDSDHSLMTDDGERVDLGVTHISESEVYSQLLFKERELKRYGQSDCA